MEQFITAIGVMPPKVATRIGYSITMGEFSEPRYEVLDEAPWGLKEALDAVYDRQQYITRPEKPAVGYEGLIPVQQIIMGPPEYLKFAMIADDPSISLRVHDERDVSKVIWGYNSAFAERQVNSQVNTLDMRDFINEVAWRKKSYGANEFAGLEPDVFGLADYSEVRNEFTALTDDALIEDIVLPKPNSSDLYIKKVNMTDLYLRRGVGMTRTLMHGLARAPRSYYNIVDENALSFIGSREGLTRDQMIRFRSAIAMSHQVAKWKRMTTNEPTFDWKRVITATTGRNIV